MAKQKFSNDRSEFIIQYRAQCEDDNFRGPWQADIHLARADARTHRAQPGNEGHVIDIVMQQTLTTRYED